MAKYWHPFHVVPVPGVVLADANPNVNPEEFWEIKTHNTDFTIGSCLSKEVADRFAAALNRACIDFINENDDAVIYT